MAERRGMEAALNLTPEKLDFIQKGTVPEWVASKPIAVSMTATESPPLKHGSLAADVVTDTVPDARTRSPRSTKSRRSVTNTERTQTVQNNQEGFYGELLVPLTTRLKPETADALRRACLEQKLARKTPNTQQEIVELALADWLENHGFLR
jgi:hypothetical protein